MADSLLTRLELHTGLGPTRVAKLLGYPYSTYAQYKSGARKIRPYLVAHVRVIMLLPVGVLEELVQEALSDERE